MAKTHSAVNKAVTTISNCEEEPIHIPGSIQPHGFLIIIDRNTGNIELCSENTDKFLLHPPLYFLSRPYTEVLPTELVGIVNDSLHIIDHDIQQIPVPVMLNGVMFDCFRRPSTIFYMLECVLSFENPYNVYELFFHNKHLLNLTDGNTTLKSFCSLVVQKIREVTGYDRVMLYRFDENYNGHVYAENVAAGTDSFLDLHYPHTDIPKQARDLYLRNMMRLIPDVYYTPVPIVTHRPELARPEIIDLSYVHLRSVSPIHIEYLKNMRVGATLTISLIKDGKLWGLIACHHNQAMQPSYIKQTQAYFLSQILSSQIGVQETAEKYRLAKQLDVHLKKLIDYLNREENFIELHFKQLNEVLLMMNATGAALVYKNKIYTNGVTPPAEFILGLQNWLESHSKTFFHTNELKIIYPEASLFIDTASGLLFHKLNANGEPSLFWFRSSVDKIITWAGNSNDQKDQSPLTPRNSFAAWQETKRGSSELWQQPELDAAFRFSYLLQQHIFHLHQRDEELRYRKLNEQLSRANKELENIHWISTHDLKEPLRKIQIFASMIESPQSLTNVDSMRKSIESIRSAASRMQGFIDDLMLYSKMSNSDLAYEVLNLNEVLQEVLPEFKEEANQGLFEIHSDQLPVILASRFQVQQLFINLIGNAIKFRKENEIQLINIRYEEVIDSTISHDDKVYWHKISISDKGVGFIMEMSNNIFDIFKRAHSQGQFEGTGMGLSICRKIMENHGGKITATGKEGEGAEFTLYFPKSVIDITVETEKVALISRDL